MTKQTFLLILKAVARIASILSSGVGAGGVVSGTLTTEHAVAFIGFGSVFRQIILVIGDIVDDGQENSSFNVNGNGSTFTGVAPSTIITPPKP